MNSRETTPKKDRSSKSDLRLKDQPLGQKQNSAFKLESANQFETEIEKIYQLIEEGVSRLAEEKATQLLKLKPRNTNILAKIRLALSKALEFQARYSESLDVLRVYENDEVRYGLEEQFALEIQTQIALLYNYLTDSPKAISLLKEILDQAAAIEPEKSLLGLIYVTLSRAYRSVGQNPIARDYANQSLEFYRQAGNRRGMVQAYISLGNISGQEGKLEEYIEYCQQALNIIGKNSENFWLGRIYSDMAGAYYLLHRPLDGIACLEKSIGYFEQTEHHANSVTAYNNLGIGLTTVGEWERAEENLQKAYRIAVKTNHHFLSMVLDSLGELFLLREKFEEAEKHTGRAVEISRMQNRKWFLVQALRTRTRYYLAIKNYRKATDVGNQYLETAKQVNDNFSVRHAYLLLAEIYLRQGKSKEFESQLAQVNIKDEDDKTDLQIAAYSQFLLAHFAKQNNDSTLAEYHFSRSLSIYEMLHEFYFSSVCLYELGVVLSQSNPKRAAENLARAIENFRHLQIKSFLDKAKKAYSALGETLEDAKRSAQNFPLLALRLTESAASRELLLHELFAVLQQESRAKKIIIAEPNEQKKLVPFAVFGFTPAEAQDITAELQNSQLSDQVAEFADSKNLSISPLADLNVPPAFLILQPRNAAKLIDGSNIQPLLKIVELGLETCALRNKSKIQLSETEINKTAAEEMLPGFVHSSPGMQAVVDEIYKIRTSDITVLITGESGTGKELVARAIHTLSNRKDRTFIPFNCTAIPKELAEGHLFGYRKGAFTGAMNDSPGVIRSADGGTLFLDEVGDLPLDVQPKLLRFLQEGEIQPLGEKKPIKVDVRVVAATNVGLEEKVAEGSFREDLFYRLNVIRLRVPPLRERRSEIPLLVNYYINHYSALFNKRNVTITPPAVDLLMVGNWDGNIRQLCNELQRLVVRAEDGETITAEHLSPELKRSGIPLSSEIDNNDLSNESFSTVFNVNRENGTLEEIIQQIEARVIAETLQRHNGNVSRVAKELKISRRNLYMKLERYGLIKPANPMSKFNFVS